MQEMLKTFKSAFGWRTCMFPSAPRRCRNKGIGAHSLERRAVLSQLATGGKVLSARRDPLRFKDWNPKEMGVGQASVFHGFCSRHDAELFAPFALGISELDRTIAGLLGFRATCHELYLKEASRRFQPMALVASRHLPTRARRARLVGLAVHYRGILQSIAELTAMKHELDRCVLSGTYTAYNYYAIVFKQRPPVAVAGNSIIETDFLGHRLWDIEPDAFAPHLNFSIVPTLFGGAAVFGWCGDNPSAVQFVQSLHTLPDRLITGAIVRYAFEYYENTYFSRAWWDGLLPQARWSLQQRIAAGIERGHTDRALTDDSFDYGDWQVANRMIAY